MSDPGGSSRNVSISEDQRVIRVGVRGPTPDPGRKKVETRPGKCRWRCAGESSPTRKVSRETQESPVLWRNVGSPYWDETTRSRE